MHVYWLSKRTVTQSYSLEAADALRATLNRRPKINISPSICLDSTVMVWHAIWCKIIRRYARRADVELGTKRTTKIREAMTVCQTEMRVKFAKYALHGLHNANAGLHNELRDSTAALL